MRDIHFPEIRCGGIKSIQLVARHIIIIENEFINAVIPEIIVNSENILFHDHIIPLEIPSAYTHNCMTNIPTLHGNSKRESTFHIASHDLLKSWIRVRIHLTTKILLTKSH